MDALRRLTTIALVLFGMLCVAAWAAWFNERAFGMIPLPFFAEQFPPDPMTGPLAFGFGSFILGYVVYPPGRDEDDRRR